MSEWTAEVADWYAESYGEYPTNRLTIQQLELDANVTVLDIGCGTASALRHAATKVTTGLLIGVDPVPRMIEIAEERLVGHAAAARIRLHVAPAHKLPLEDASVDVVLALDSYDHWGPHQQAGLKEARRVLALSGQLVIVKDLSVPHSDSAKQELRETLSEAGFTLVNELETTEDDVSFTTWVCV